MPYTDMELLFLYREWSEQRYSAGFIEPDFQRVAEFRAWLKKREKEGPHPIEDYEAKMLQRYHAQEKTEKEAP